jgi:UDP-3-O-[3-hydroxymyristoyl] glucosamine N-acyltransferase
MTDSAQLLVVTLAGAGDEGRWVHEFVGSAPYVILAVSERTVEAEVRAALRERPAIRQAVVTIDQRFMGFLAKRAIDTLRGESIQLPVLVHPLAAVAPDAILGEGARVAAGAVVSASCHLGEHARVLERAVLGRSCRVGAFSTLDAGTLLGEGALVGSHCWLRGGLVVEPRTTIGDSVELSAGVVRGNIPAGTLHIAGLDAPARIHRFG